MNSTGSRGAGRTCLFAALCCFLTGLGAPAQEAPPVHRAVSLTALQQSLRAAGGRPAPGLLALCGLTRVEGYTLDPRTRDLILFGTVDPAAPPLSTEDLAVALRSAWGRYAVRRGRTLFLADPGCSIDPNPDTFRRLSEVAVGANDGDGDIEERLDQWCAISKEPQKVRVEGIPFHSHFGKTLVDADYFMKRLVDGSVTLDIPGFRSLIDSVMEASAAEAAQTGKIPGPASSFNRFWFYPGRNRYGVDGDTVTLLDCPVTLLTEEQYLTGSGVAGRGRPEPLALQFADSFTAHYAEIAAREPRYQQLEGLFRFVALAKVMEYRRLPVDLSYLLDRFPVARTPVPESLPGVCRVKYLEQQYESPGAGATQRLWLPSCGGVRIAVNVAPSDFVSLAPAPPKAAASAGKPKAGTKARASTKTRAARATGARKSPALAARPSPKALYWDY
jgi:hypothetical protein